MSEQNEKKQDDEAKRDPDAKQLSRELVANHQAASPDRAEDIASDAPDAPLAEEPSNPTIVVGTPVEPDETAAAPSDAPAESEAELARKTQAADAQVIAASRQHTRRSFLGAAAAVAAGFGAYHYLNVAPNENMQPVPLEDAYDFNAAATGSYVPP